MDIYQSSAQRLEKSKINRLVINKRTAFPVWINHPAYNQFIGIVYLLPGKKLLYPVFVTRNSEACLNHSVGGRIPQNSGICLLPQDQ